MLALVVLLLCLGLVHCQKPVVSQCIDTVAGALCLDITSKECFELTGSVSLAGEYIFSPTSMPIANLLTQIQNQKNDPDAGNLMCFHLTESSVYGSCSLCATIDQLKMEGDSIHYCGSGQLNCSSLIAPPLYQQFNIPCIDIQNCGLFNCRNNCNGRGTCTSFGMCECNSGYYGYDCSVQLIENCVSGPLFDSTCWSVISNCDSIDLKLSTKQSNNVMRYQSVKDFIDFSIVPCKSVIREDNLECDMCLAMENIHPEGTGFNGCPTISMTCNSILARSESIDCIHISSTSACETSSNQPQSTTNYSNQIMFGLGLILVMLVILAIGFIMVKKLRLFAASNQQELYVEDEEPLNNNEY